MLLFISDIHLTDELSQPPVPWAQTFQRFWSRIEASKGEQPAHLCIVGDFIDIVRSPRWLRGPHRPYHDPSPGLAAEVEAIVSAVLLREAAFFGAIRAQVQSGQLIIHYLLGNHDRLMAHAPVARRALWRALTGEDRPIDFPESIDFEQHKVIAHHGHTGDFICHDAEGGAPVSDIFGIELIVRFPDAVRARIDFDLPHLDDIDDVRPIYAVPSWIRQISSGRHGLMKPVSETWTELVSEFLENDHFKEWVRRQRRVMGLSPGAQLQRMLQLSTGRAMATASDKRLTRAFKMMQHLFDGKFAERAAHRLEDQRGFQYVINGHSHFPSMTPLGNIHGKPTVYFNSGTWRTVHQIGTHAAGRPTFLPYHAMSYIAFFPDDDTLRRDFEWWTGAMVARESPDGGTMGNGR